jgi:5'-nucleotidase
LGKRLYKQVVVEKEDPRGRQYFWIAGTPEWQEEEGTDHAAVSSGLVSVTPLHLDLTDYRGLEESPQWSRRLRRLAESLSL